MSAFDFTDVFESLWGSDPTGGKGEVATVNLREAGEEEGATEDGLEVWGTGCVVYRPAKPTDKGKCQAMVASVGGRRVVVATQDLRANECTGAMNDGDAAFCSPTGRNVLKMGGAGGIHLVQQTDSDDASIAIEKDGTILQANQYGVVELGPNGFVVTLASGEQFQLTQGYAQIVAPQAFMRAGCVGLGLAPAVPLTFAAPSGVAKPAPSVFV